MNQAEKDALISLAYQNAENSLSELIANVRPATHCATPMSTMIEGLKENIRVLRDALYTSNTAANA
jgi:hypothetical protein